MLRITQRARGRRTGPAPELSRAPLEVPVRGEACAAILAAMKNRPTSSRSHLLLPTGPSCGTAVKRPCAPTRRRGVDTLKEASMKALRVALLALLVAWPTLAAAQTIKVGAVVPLTGRYGGGGAQGRAGYEIGGGHGNAT